MREARGGELVPRPAQMDLGDHHVAAVRAQLVRVARDRAEPGRERERDRQEEGQRHDADPASDAGREPVATQLTDRANRGPEDGAAEAQHDAEGGHGRWTRDAP